ncbi:MULTISPECIES: hypothetical protein [Paenibacillus]|uniref:hypothetical protein n=1 Tax=Paenibacillus TaxID=44249 RepID=UPI00096C111E|nr:hypothetical protein [Paenibacillus odorifer]OMC70065.1 hypothetical protein BK121_15890 [Paenibacillus odorifer]
MASVRLVPADGVVTFILRQYRLAQPILEFRVFQDPVYSLTTILGVFTFTSMIGTETLIPVFMQNMLGYNALESGLALLPGCAPDGRHDAGFRPVVR